jgi:RNA polymerase sigma-70 factor, ECF subfamily
VTDDVAAVVAALARIETPRLTAAAARIVRDIGVAEELVQDALLAALEQWPGRGVPEQPGAWLQTTVRHRAIDHVRRAVALERKQYQLVRERQLEQDLGGAAPEGGERLGDDVLELVFVCCHPALVRPARVALTLRLIGALSTAEIASAFLLEEATIAQRIVRAKRTLAQSQVSFELPVGDELARRLPAVLEVVYLVFNEGYAASGGEHWTRPELCLEALRLGRMVAARMPDAAEAHGLAALMELQASRLPARGGSEPVLLGDQDRRRWDRVLIARGLAALTAAERARTAVSPRIPGRVGEAVAPLAPPGPYELQAQIAACHARARTLADTDWIRISALYAALALQVPSPVVELNRAVAVGMAFGPAAGLELVDAVAQEPALAGYPLLPGVRGELLRRLGREHEARAEFERAAALSSNAAARALMRAKRDSG